MKYDPIPQTKIGKFPILSVEGDFSNLREEQSMSLESPLSSSDRARINHDPTKQR